MRNQDKLAALALVGAWALMAAGPALAAGRYQKQTMVQVKAVKSDRLKVEPKKDEAPKRPALMAEQFRAAAQVKVAALTDAAIATLKRLIQATDDKDPEKPDFFFRLAEHYREKKEQEMFKARALDEQIFLSRSSGEKARLQGQQKGYERAEQQWLVEAIKMYLLIATKQEYDKYKRMDEVLFNVADMLSQAKKHEKARIFFRKLIRNYPQSKYIPDAYLSFAEYYFNEGQVENALKLYEQVGKYPNSPIYGFAVYKQGWCWLNLKDPSRALEMFVQVIRNASQWSGPQKSKLALVKEAKKDAVKAYALVGKPDRAWPFFQRIGGDYAMKMLEALADLYLNQGKSMDAIQTFRKLIALDPKSKDLCNWQYSIMKATLTEKDKRTQVVEAKRLAAVYETGKSQGTVRGTALNECRANAMDALRTLATTWHSEAQKTQNQETYDLAQYVYKEYLDHFPNEKDSYEMAFYYAELLYKLEKWPSAAEAYSRVVHMKSNGKYLKEAAYAAVISWKNALNVEEARGENVSKKAGGKVDYSKPLPIPDNQQKMMAAFDIYIKNVPNSPELVQIMYNKGRIYYEYNHHKKAVEIFGQLVTKYPEHELAEYAANHLLDALNIIKDYTELNVWVNRMLAEPKLASRESLKKVLDGLKLDSMWKRAEQLREGKQYKDCGTLYAKLANDYQEDPRWAKMLFNAAMCFEASKLIGQAISIRESLIKVKPNDPLAKKSLLMIGRNYQALAWYSRAAERLEKFAKEFPGEEGAADALHDAIAFRVGRAEYKEALDDAEFFTKTYGKRKGYASKTAAVNFGLATIYEMRKDAEGVVKHYTKYLQTWGKEGGLDRQVQAHVRIGETLWRQSCPVPGVNGACIKVDRVKAKRKLAAAKKKRAKGAAEVRTQCGPETKSKITVVKRSPAKARAAQTHFKEALALFKRTKGITEGDKEEREKRQSALQEAAQAARFYQAEGGFEDFLGVKFPEGLDFSPKNKQKLQKSQKEFLKYLENKSRLLTATTTAYEDVIKMRHANWAIAALARVGQLSQNFADALYTAPIPKFPVPAILRTKEDKEDFLSQATDTYCDTLEDKAAPRENAAIDGFSKCLSKSTEMSWYNEWSGLCEAELNQIKPAEYPIAAEIRAEPGYMSATAARANVIAEIK